MTKPVADRLRELEEEQRAIHRDAHLRQILGGGNAGYLDHASEWSARAEELASLAAEVEAVAEVFRASGETHSEIEGGTDYTRFWLDIADRLSREKP